MKTNNNITVIFNVILFLYLCFVSTVKYLFEPENNQKVPWDHVYEWSPNLSIIFAIVLLIGTLLWGAILSKFIWNKFLSDIFKLRSITYNEALTIVMVIYIFTV